MRIFITLLIAAAAAAALPLLNDMSLLNVLIKVFIAAIFALGFNLLWGQGGLLSFGHAAYFGLGTFATIFTMDAIDRGLPFPTPFVPLAGALAGFVFGLFAGWFATIRSGVYFAMITVAIAELIAAVAVKWDAVFGGEGGIRSVRSPWGPLQLQSTVDVYFMALAWLVAVVVFLLWLQRSPWGLILRGIREREERVRFLGYDSHAVKTLAFALSAGVSGLAGGLLALSDEAANMVLFHGSGSAFVVLNTVIGGAGVFGGPIIGAALTTLFGYYVANATHYWMLYLGMLFIVLVIYAPAGLAGLAVGRYAAVRAGEAPILRLGEVLGAVGVALCAFGTVLSVELVGAVLTPEYAAQTLRNAGVWPPVSVLWIAWAPLSPLTWLAIAGSFVGGAVSLRAASGGWAGLLPRFAQSKSKVRV
jgi:branched-chain amino acid transport system permease protein